MTPLVSARGVVVFEIEIIVLTYKKEKSTSFEVLFSGAPAGTRTLDTRLKRAMLYRLSYWGI